MTLEQYMPRAAGRLADLFERLDPVFAEVWTTHQQRLLSRTQLDQRTRMLVMTSQYTVTRMHEPLGENLEAAIEAGVDPTHLLEAILQCYVYTGTWIVATACEVFESVMARHPDAARSDPTADVNAGRNLEVERSTWSATDASDVRVDRIIETYGWHGFSNGLRLRPGHHINLVDTLDALDPDYLRAWLDAVYDGMYGRGVLDDRTRLLCVVGATLALGEKHQSRRHMRAALRAGAAPTEVLEVAFSTTAIFGHPHVMPAVLDDLIRILDDEGRISELIAADRIDSIRAIVAARVARREGVQDDISETR